MTEVVSGDSRDVRTELVLTATSCSATGLQSNSVESVSRVASSQLNDASMAQQRQGVAINKQVAGGEG